MPPHIHTAIVLDAHALGHQQYGLVVPSGHGASCAADDAVAGQVEFQRGIVHGPSHEAAVCGPAYERGNAAVGKDVSGRNLPDDVIHFCIERSGVGTSHHRGEAKANRGLLASIRCTAPLFNSSPP
jgi:hypothetical protein